MSLLRICILLAITPISAVRTVHTTWHVPGTFHYRRHITIYYPLTYRYRSLGTQGSQVSRETHPMQTLTRHTVSLTQRKYQDSAHQFVPLFNSGTGRNQMGFPVTRRPLLPGHALFLRHFKKNVWRNFKIVRDFY